MLYVRLFSSLATSSPSYKQMDSQTEVSECPRAASAYDNRVESSCFLCAASWQHPNGQYSATRFLYPGSIPVASACQLLRIAWGEAARLRCFPACWQHPSELQAEGGILASSWSFGGLVVEIFENNRFPGKGPSILSFPAYGRSYRRKNVIRVLHSSLQSKACISPWSPMERLWKSGRRGCTINVPLGPPGISNVRTGLPISNNEELAGMRYGVATDRKSRTLQKVLSEGAPMWLLEPWGLSRPTFFCRALFSDDRVVFLIGRSEYQLLLFSLVRISSRPRPDFKITGSAAAAANPPQCAVLRSTATCPWATLPCLGESGVWKTIQSL